MLSRTVVVFGLLGLMAAPCCPGCVDLPVHRAHTLPRRPCTRPSLDNATASANARLSPNPAARVERDPRPALVAEASAPKSSTESLPEADKQPLRVSNSVQPQEPSNTEPAVVRVAQVQVPPPPQHDSDPPTKPSVNPNEGKIKKVSLDDPSQPPPVPSVVKPSSAGSGRTDALDANVPLRNLHRSAVQRYESIDSYIVRMSRREQVNGKDKPEELILFQFRKKPWSVYFKWLGIQGRGREVIYVKGRHGNSIHTLLAAEDMPLMPAGKRMALAPDNIFVRAASRHSITEAGIGNLIEQFGQVLDAIDAGDSKRGTMKYLGMLPRPEFEKPLEAVEQSIPQNAETLLPKGGSRLWMFDPITHLPAIVITYDHAQHEVEYYCYDRLQSPVRLDDDDFNPDKVWKQK